MLGVLPDEAVIFRPQEKISFRSTSTDCHQFWGWFHSIAPSHFLSANEISREMRSGPEAHELFVYSSIIVFIFLRLYCGGRLHFVFLECCQGWMKYRLDVDSMILWALPFFKYSSNSRCKDSLSVYFLNRWGTSQAYMYSPQESNPSTLFSGQ